ncbi:hypothetical protein [uncultured Psychroserpens sp.]|uniref:hypothetical protein n=1 Tax=uncultured Psychroserpens sp. TaxID=255436 RepID=UPI002608FB32|nr:hypothetical protein [uncultured Psychroserpens sp.]
MFKKIVAVLFLAIVISAILIAFNEDKFDQTEWITNPTERYKMSKDIIESKLLLGKSRQDILVLLGTPAISNLEGKDHIVYSLGETPSFFETNERRLIIIFKDSLVSKVIHSNE